MRHTPIESTGQASHDDGRALDWRCRGDDALLGRCGQHYIDHYVHGGEGNDWFVGFSQAGVSDSTSRWSSPISGADR